MAPDTAAMRAAVLAGSAEQARALAEQAVAAGMDLLEVVEQGFGAGIRAVGELWESGEYFLPELVQGAAAMQAAMAVLTPVLATRPGGPAPRGRIVIGSVQGDLHDIGKGLVAVLLSAHGFEVYDLGTDVPVATFVAKAREVDADVVAASALLTSTMQGQRELVQAVRAAGFARPPRVLVGGAPTSAGWASEIGAAYAEDALRAVAVARELLA